MDVVLDTNACWRDRLTGANFKALRNYLSRTRSSLVLPVVVVEEMVANRSRELATLQSGLRKLERELSRLAPGTAAALPAIDIPAELVAYRAWLAGVAEQVEHPGSDPSDIGELIRRLSNRIPPASQAGEEARDVLLWLICLRLGQKQRLALVSNDKKAIFKKSGGLRNELAQDLVAMEAQLEVFSSIDAFLKVHHARSSFIHKPWLTSRIDTPLTITALDEFIEASTGIFDGFLRDDAEPTGHLNLVQIVQFDVEDFFVSDIDGGKLYVSAEVCAELEIEVEYSEYSPRLEYDERRNHFSECIYPQVRVTLQFEVVDSTVQSAAVGAIQ